MQGTVFDIQRFSTHDGPGIRTTVFFKGCPLRCKWCHNPEGLDGNVQPQHIAKKCIGCNTCGGSISLENARICPSGAISQCGSVLSPQQVISHALTDRIYYTDGGGITFSGGECLMQSDFLLACLELAKQEGLHTAIDTSGYAPWEVLERTASYCDLYLYDIKCIDPIKHKQFTGVDNKVILDNLTKLCKKDIPIWVRVPVVPTFNADLTEMSAIADFLKGLKSIERITLMPYHSLGKNKYSAVGLTPCDFTPPEASLMDRLKQCFDREMLK